MSVEPMKYMYAMEAHWTNTLGNVSSPKLRMLWDIMCRTFNKQITNHATPEGNLWRVLDPATGTGKTQGLAVYCSMLPREGHPGVLIVTRMKLQAEEIANTINALAGDEVATACHSDSKVSPIQLSFKPVVVITHRAFEIGLDAINRGQAERSNYAAFTAWGLTGRRLTVIDEALNVVEEAQVTLEAVNYILGVIPPAIKRKYADNFAVIKDTQRILEDFEVLAAKIKAEAEAAGEKVRTKDTPMWVGKEDLPERTDFTDLRRELRDIKFDRIVLRQEDDHARRRLAKHYDKTLRCIQATVEQWHWYSKDVTTGHTLNTARLIVPEEAPGVVIMDATARQNIVYNLLPNVSLAFTPDGVRKYDAVNLHVSTGHRVGKRYLSNKKNVKNTAAQLVTSLERMFGPERKVLVVCHMAVEPYVKHLQTHFEEFHVAHWHALDGRNDWDDCDVCILFGLPYPRDTRAPNVFMAIKGVQDEEWFTDVTKRRFGDVPDIREGIKNSQMIVECVQAFNRCRVRRVVSDDGNCDTADLVFMLPNDKTGEAILEGVKADMPGMKVKEFQYGDVKAKVRKSNHEEALVAYAGAMHPGRQSASNVKADLGISPAQWKRMASKMKDETSALFAALSGAGVQYVVTGAGQGTRAHLVKA